MIKIEKRNVDRGVLVIDLIGRMTVSSVDRCLVDIISGCVAENQINILLNMGEVSVIDVDGIRQLNSIFIAMHHARGRIKILNPGKQVLGVFQRIGTPQIIPIHHDETEAIESFA